MSVAQGFPEEFAAALREVREAQYRPELSVHEITPPTGLAPHSFALAADVHPAHHREDSELAVGRLIVLYDPQEPEAWQGVFRIVCYAQAPLETDLGSDPFIADVAWSWIEDSLARREAPHHALSGTATTIQSTGYGALAAQGRGAQLEMRASWTPEPGGLSPHIAAWGDFLSSLAGLPPLADGVSLLQQRHRPSAL